MSAAKIAQYRKVIAAFLGQALTYATLCWGNGPDARYVAIAVGVASALGVYAVPNASSGSAAPSPTVSSAPPSAPKAP